MLSCISNSTLLKYAKYIEEKSRYASALTESSIRWKRVSNYKLKQVLEYRVVFLKWNDDTTGFPVIEKQYDGTGRGVRSNTYTK